MPGIETFFVSVHRERFLDIVDGRVDVGGMTMMKDIALKGLSGVPGERVVNKVQDIVWDDILSEHCQLPKVRNFSLIFTNRIRSITKIFLYCLSLFSLCFS